MINKLNIHIFYQTRCILLLSNIFIKKTTFLLKFSFISLKRFRNKLQIVNITYTSIYFTKISANIDAYCYFIMFYIKK